MTSTVPLFAGLVAGLSIAVPVGPMGLLCIQRTLSSGFVAGLSTGLGGATANVLASAVVLLGLERVSDWMAGGGRVLGVVGSAVLLWTAARTFARAGRAGVAAPLPAQSPLAAYGSAVLYNLGNPASLLLIVGLLSPVVGVPDLSGWGMAALLLGVFLAAAGWWVVLTGTVALLRHRLSPRVLVVVNRAAGVVLTIYGALALMRAGGG